jgi:uncharacterized protein DUF5946
VKSACPGCGLVLQPQPEAPKHPYIGASAECWALYGELLAREFHHPAYFRVHQLTVDTYAVQHPGSPERRATQSVGLHLMTLCLIVEDGVDPSEGPALHKRLVRRPAFRWLEPPRPNGQLTAADALRSPNPEEHAQAVTAWGQDVWEAWAPHHQTVCGWIEESAAS